MLNDSVYELSPGCASIVDRFVPHSFGYTDQDRDLMHLWVSFGNRSRHGFVCHVREAGKYEIIQAVMFPAELIQLFLQRWEQLAEQQNISDRTVMDFMQLPVELLINEFFLKTRYPAAEKLHMTNISGVVKNYIRNCNGRDCNMAKLSDVLGYSASHLAHVFRLETGMSIGDFINVVRLEYTQQALENGMTQKEISNELGFASYTSFWNWFQKYKKTLLNTSSALQNS